MEFIQTSPETGQESCALRRGKAPAGTGASRKTTQQNNRRGHYTRRLPPFGKVLVNRLRQGQRPSNCIWVACGAKAWDRARYDLKRSDRAALCLPYGDSPTAYRWPVSELDCLVIPTGGLDAKTLRTLDVELIRTGAALAVIIGAKDELRAPIVSFKSGRAKA